VYIFISIHLSKADLTF